MPEAEATAFADALERASAAGRVFAASNFYPYLARRGGKLARAGIWPRPDLVRDEFPAPRARLGCLISSS